MELYVEKWLKSAFARKSKLHEERGSKLVSPAPSMYLCPACPLYVPMINIHNIYQWIRVDLMRIHKIGWMRIRIQGIKLISTHPLKVFKKIKSVPRP